MRIKKGGIRRECTEREYNTKFKRLGYVIAPKEVKNPLKDDIDVDKYHKGGGWYEYEGETYRKDDLLRKLGE